MDVRSQVRLVNTAERTAEQWWSWTVWLEGPDEALDRVQSVKYTLHHTFLNPVRLITDRASKFALKSAGWGEFALHAQVTTGDDQSFPLTRWLTFSSDTETGALAERKPTLFLSYGATERPFATALKDELAAQGVKVVGAEDAVSLGASIQHAISDAMEHADVVAFITSGELRGFAEVEIDEARKRQKPIVPIVVGDTEPPDALRTTELIRLRPKGGTGAVADLLAARVKDKFFT